MATIGNLGGYTMPFIIGWVRQLTQQVEFGLYAMAAMMMIGGLVMLVIPKLRRVGATSGERPGNSASAAQVI